MSDVIIRDADHSDLPAILSITNDAILQGTAIWLIEPVTLDQRRVWFEDRVASGFPVLVAEIGNEVCGFGSYGSFRPYEGYAHTVENSLYIRRQTQRRGVGGALLDALILAAVRDGKHVMIAGIEAGNVASIALHERAGFLRGGVLAQVGYKFDRWLDLLFMHKRLDDGAWSDDPAEMQPEERTEERS